MSVVQYILSNASPDFLASSAGLGSASAAVALFAASLLLLSKFMRSHLSLTLVAAMTPAFLVWSFQNSGLEASVNYRLMQPPKANSVGASSRNGIYWEKLTEYEAKYPQINPDSDSFNEDLTNKIGARMKSLRSEGLSPEAALTAAIQEALPESENASSHQAQTKIIESSPADRIPASVRSQCERVYWATMNTAKGKSVADYAETNRTASASLQRCFEKD